MIPGTADNNKDSMSTASGNVVKVFKVLASGFSLLYVLTTLFRLVTTQVRQSWTFLVSSSHGMKYALLIFQNLFLLC